MRWKLSSLIFSILIGLGYYQQQANQTIGSQSGVLEHRRILEAIREKDGELAGLLMKRHIQRSRRDICRYREEQ